MSPVTVTVPLGGAYWGSGPFSSLASRPFSPRVSGTNPRLTATAEPSGRIMGVTNHQPGSSWASCSSRMSIWLAVS